MYESLKYIGDKFITCIYGTLAVCATLYIVGGTIYSMVNPPSKEDMERTQLRQNLECLAELPLEHRGETIGDLMELLKKK
jgi:hypothetical protein|tara:strand:+ start:312 stop:551 length:240 start_codon:yes stop_codon:yes gene_type:complete